MLQALKDLLMLHPVFMFLLLALGVSFAVAVHDGIEWLWKRYRGS